VRAIAAAIIPMIAGGKTCSFLLLTRERFNIKASMFNKNAATLHTTILQDSRYLAFRDRSTI
jgi:hypothetical protein